MYNISYSQLAGHFKSDEVVEDLPSIRGIIDVDVDVCEDDDDEDDDEDDEDHNDAYQA